MKKDKKMSLTEQRAHAMLQFYQAGFLDGLNSTDKLKMKVSFNRYLKKKCIKAFEMRFAMRMAKVRKKK